MSAALAAQLKASFHQPERLLFWQATVAAADGSGVSGTVALSSSEVPGVTCRMGKDGPERLRDRHPLAGQPNASLGAPQLPRLHEKVRRALFPPGQP